MPARKWSPDGSRTKTYVAISTAGPLGLNRFELREALPELNRHLLDDALFSLRSLGYIELPAGKGSRYRVRTDSALPRLPAQAIESIVFAAIEDVPDGCNRWAIEEATKARGGTFDAAIAALEKAGRIERFLMPMTHGSGIGWRVRVGLASAGAGAGAAASAVMAPVDIDAVHKHQPTPGPSSAQFKVHDGRFCLTWDGVYLSLPKALTREMFAYLDDLGGGRLLQRIGDPPR